MPTSWVLPSEISSIASREHRWGWVLTSKYFFSVNHEHVRNSFSDGKKSLLNSEYNLDKKFKTLIKYPELGHLIWENNKLDYDGSDILFYIYEMKM